MTKKREPKSKHHFIPQTYLKNFLNSEERLYKFDKEKNSIEPQGKGGTFHKYKFYSFDFSKGKRLTDVEAEVRMTQFGLQYNKESIEQVETHPDMIEDLFGYSENNWDTLLEKLTSKTELSSGERDDISFFITFMFLRNPQTVQLFSELEEKLTKIQIKETFATREKIKTIYKSMKEDGYSKDIDIDAIYDTVNENRFDIEIPREIPLQRIMMLSSFIADIFNNKSWLVFEAPKDSSFLTNDFPVIVDHPFNKGKDFLAAGLLAEGARIIFPLSQKYILIMYAGEVDKSGVYYGSLEKIKTRGLNRLIVARSQRYFVGRDRALVESFTKVQKS